MSRPPFKPFLHVATMYISFQQIYINGNEIKVHGTLTDMHDLNNLIGNSAFCMVLVGGSSHFYELISLVCVCVCVCVHWAIAVFVLCSMTYIMAVTKLQ